MSKLHAVVQQYLDNGGAAVASPALGWLSTAAGGTPSLNCNNTGWIPLNVCSYISALPDDPMVGQSRACAGPGVSPGCNNGVAAPQPMRYRVCMDAGGNFVVDVRQESQSNLTRVTNDFPGQQPDSWAEVRSLNTIAVPPAPCGAN